MALVLTAPPAFRIYEAMTTLNVKLSVNDYPVSRDNHTGPCGFIRTWVVQNISFKGGGQIVDRPSLMYVGAPPSVEKDVTRSSKRCVPKAVIHLKDGTGVSPELDTSACKSSLKIIPIKVMIKQSFGEPSGTFKMPFINHGRYICY